MQQRIEVSFKLRSVVKHNFAWKTVSSQTCVVKKMAYPERLFIILLIITTPNLIEVIFWHFDNLKPTHIRVNHSHAGETDIILNDISARMMLSHRLTIWTYQVHMHHKPRFQFCNIIGWKTSMKSLYLFKLLTYITWLIIQILLWEKTFPITHLSYCFRKYTTAGVVQIEMLPIQHTSAQSLRHVYFSIIVYYLDFSNSLLRVIRSLNLNICAEFGI